ncbi:MAG: hypothetical protein ACLUFV_04735 [Acutalibacteraceae bacterium]
MTGDLNGDGTLTASDYLLAKRAIVLDAELTKSDPRRRRVGAGS